MENNSWERKTIEKVLLQSIKEQRANRRSKIMWRSLFIIIILLGIYWIKFSGKSVTTEKQVALIELKSTISDENNSYNNFAQSLDEALKDKNTLGVIIKANSPGGSPVYSDMINQEIYRQRNLHKDIPIYFAIEEVCASGCYYAAVAANKIYAQKASIVGSIGVISPGFGMTELIKKLGVDNRLLTAGKYKAMGYPFSPQNPDVTKIQQDILNQIHQQFITAVKTGRPHLKNDPDLFSGRYWIGSQALDLGLIDGYATVDSIARDQFKSDNIVNFTKNEDTFDKISKKFGVSVIDSAKNAILAEDIKFN